jgi:hypothetical protein
MHYFLGGGPAKNGSYNIELFLNNKISIILVNGDQSDNVGLKIMMLFSSKHSKDFCGRVNPGIFEMKRSHSLICTLLLDYWFALHPHPVKCFTDEYCRFKVH